MYINYSDDPNIPELVARIAPLPKEKEYDYLIEYIEPDKDVMQDKYPWRRCCRSGWNGFRKIDVNVIEKGCRGVFICINDQCLCKRGGVMRYIEAAPISDNVFANKLKSSTICATCGSTLIYQSCSAILGELSFINAGSRDGYIVKGKYRINSHSANCYNLPNRNGIPSESAKTVRELAKLVTLPNSNMLLKGCHHKGVYHSWTKDNEALFDYYYREKILKRVRILRKVSPARFRDLAAQFNCIELYDGPLADFVANRTVGHNENNYLFLQTINQRKKMDLLIRLIMKYKEIELRLGSEAALQAIMMNKQY